jgi:hypothetical protein
MSGENVKKLVSMIVGDDKVTLITIEGEIIDIQIGDMYDTGKLVDELTPKLSGLAAVEVDLDDYLAIKQALFPDDYEGEGEIIVRVVEGKEIKGIFFPLKIEVAVKSDDGEVVVPSLENLKPQIQRAIDTNSPSVRNFLNRITPVIKDRLHSAEDLMQFIKKSDLPLTDAGEIIAYKRVNKKGDDYVDCHTGKVIQNIGSRVYTDADKVDPDRTRSCSNGLHVGSLSFMKSFHGGHTLICLVKPEDFIAVPQYDTTKCRVCEYRVIGVLSDEDRNTINSGKHITTAGFGKLIADAVAGIMAPITHDVYVEGRGETTITKRGQKAPEPAPTKEPKEVKPETGKSLLEDTPKDTGKKVVEKAKAAKKATLAEMARDLFKAKSWTQLMDFKKAKKKSWKALGFSSQEETEIMNKAG